MKLTKKLEAEILKVYHTYWDAYLMGDLQTMAKMLDENISVFGTAVSEVFSSKQETMDFYKATAEQMTGKAHFRNRKIRLQAVGENVLTTEQCDLYILMDEEWTFYGPARITALFQQTKSGWKAVHQHGSFPDSRTEEGEQISTERIKEENLKLREAIKRRTIDLENKNRELEIESTLERVRSVALSMKSPADMLSICKTISEQLEKLGVKDIRNVQTAIFYPQRGTYMNYEFYAKHNRTFITDVEYKNHKIQVAFARKMMKGANEKVVEHLKGDKLKDWYNYQKSTNQFADKYILTAHSLNYYWYSLGPVALGISTYAPLNKDELELFQRFMKVFELAYRRYLDIEKAEAQAREAQIEASLEKVRARSLAMQKPGELTEVATLLRSEMGALGVEELETSSIYIVGENDTAECWYAIKDVRGKHTKLVSDEMTLQLNETWVGKEMQKFYHSEKEQTSIVMKGQHRKDWINYCAKKSKVLKGYYGAEIPERTYHLVKFPGGYLGAASPASISNESWDLLKRAAVVFSLAYTRFKDLQDAESRANEAQVELALERVRARSLAMHHTSELQEVVNVVAQQLLSIGIDINGGVFIVINDEVEEDIPLWASAGMTDYVQKVVAPFLNRPFFARLRAALKKRNHLYIEQCTHNEKTQLFEHLFQYEPWKSTPTKRKRELLSRAGGLSRSIAVSHYTSIAMTDHYGRKFSDSENEILIRFGKVFEQSYIRFLDLKKAEAQAREAQIEAALERIRARALAMHQSEEFTEVAKVLREQMGQLGQQELETSAVHLYNEDADNILSWRAFRLSSKSTGNITYGFFKIPKASCAIAREFVQKFKSKATDYTIDVSGAKQTEWYKILFNLAPEVGEAMKKSGTTKEKRYYHFSKFSGGALLMVSSREPAGDVVELQKRSAQVFDLAYRRFKDLQKAEAQAREAEIQLALERVRARTMAMQKSEELPETSLVLYEQLKQLGEPAEQLTIGVVHEENNAIEISATVHGGVLNKIHWHSIDEPFMMNKVYQAWKTQQKTLIVELKGDQLNAYNKYRNQLTNSEMFPTDYDDEHRRIVYAAFFSKGMLALAANEPRPPQTLELLERFASVFDLTYTRFLDLQNAEEQAREAQIEAALERVRSRSMAMHKSEELKEVIRLVLEQFIHLNIKAAHAGFYIDYKAHDDMHIWLADPNLEPFYAVIPYFDTPTWNSFLEAKAKGITLHTDLLDFKTKNKFYRSLFKLFPVPEEAKKFYLQCKGLAVSTVLLDSVGLYIENFDGTPYSDEENSILLRFGKVFQQTYTRFLDLQKAEAQAREAQIEAALERVRSRTIGMQHSNELKDAANLLFQQILDLGVPVFGCGFNIWDEDRKFTTAWMSGQDRLQEPFKVSTSEDIFNRIYNANERGESLFVEEQAGEALKTHYAYMNSIPVFKAIADKMAAVGQTFPTFQIMHCAFFSQGYLMFITFEPVPSANDIFKRFTKVFEQTYTRFLDLQKAEAQAREAQIEAALERVRARAMAMHSSKELNEVVHELRKQMGLLGQKDLETCVIHLHDESSDFIYSWAAIKPPETESEILESTARVPKKGLLIIEEALEAYAANQQDYIIINEGKKLKQWFSFLKKESPQGYSKLAESVKGKIENLRAFWSFADFAGGSLLMVTMDEPDDLTRDLLRRFANVFGLAYRRFADLKQAEAQAREAQIEAALERVRSRSMAMHKSEELAELSLELVKQVQALGVATWFCAFNIYDDDPNSSLEWGSNGQGVFSKYRTPREGVFLRYYEAGQRGETLLINEIGEEECPTHYEYLCSLPGVGDQLLKMKEAGIPFPASQIDHVAFFKHGYIIFITYEPVPDTHDIFKRFARVFEQSYTRFLDLKNAEAQAREAQVEAALEKVRAKVMAMNSSNDLNATSLVFGEQLRKLGIDWQFSYFWLIEEDKDDHTFWITWPDHQTSTTSYSLAEADQSFKDCIIAWRNQEKIHGTHVPVEYVQSWLDTFDRITYDAGGVAVEIMKAERFKEGVFYYDAMIKFGSFGILMNRATNDEEKTIQSRFATEFERAYTRFLDLQRAEAQAREGQIQLALERVRARTMAMQKSEELAETAAELFHQVRSLGIESYASGFTVWENNDTELVSWMSNADGSVNPPFRMPAKENAWHHRQLASWKKREDYIIHEFAGKEMQQYYGYLRSFPLLNESFSKSEAAGIATPPRQVHNVFNFAQGNLLFITLKPVPESYDIFRRFAQTFEQSYTRFLDLKKAEAQAREAQIEAALERVRSRTMGMQKSTELNEVAFVLFEQIRLLGGQLWGSGFALCNEQPGYDEFWFANEMGVMPPVSIPNTEDDVHKAMLQGWKQKQEYLLSEKGGDALAAHYEYLYSLPQLKEFFDPMLAAGFNFPTWQQWHTAYFSKGYLLIITTGPYAESDIFRRFAKVFDQTYTRFLDLQKAEAQARDAQIEAALERVRSSAMAMHHSNELAEVAKVMFNQIKMLGGDLFAFGIVLCDKQENTVEQWHGLGEGEMMTPFRVPVDLDYIHRYRYDQWKAGVELFSIEIPSDYIAQHFQLMFELPSVKAVMDDLAEKGINIVPPSWEIDYGASFKHGYLLVSSLKPFQEEKIFPRFAKVFEQAYTRFLDLKTAEANAREAQIEAALERIRSKSLAMHHSSELSAVVDTLLQEFTKLKFSLTFCIINLINGDDLSNTVWAANPETGKGAESYYMKFEDYDFHRAMWNAWKAQDKRFVYTMEGEEKRIYDEYLYTDTEFRRFPKHVQEANKALPRYVAGFTFFKYSGLQTVSVNEITESELEILERFGRVFEQAYTRFLDLQKAEAQAREVQIQLALERARAQSMMMQHSKELDETLRVFHEQVLQLGIPSAFSFLWLPDEEKERHIFWAAWQAHKSFGSKAINYPLDRNEPATAQCLVDWKSKPVVSYHVPPEGVESYFAAWSELIDGVEHLKAANFSEGLYYVEAFNKYGCFGVLVKNDLEDDEKKILYRFAAEFEQTYTRFLDLQKAEAQAREGQIQLALERVRARTMAMQKSDELSETAELLFQQFKSLGEDMMQMTIAIVNEDERVLDFSVTDWSGGGAGVNRLFKLSIDEPILISKMYQAWKSKKKSIIVDLTGKDLEHWISYRNKMSGIEIHSQDTKGRRVINIASFSKGLVSFSSPDMRPAASIQILERFAGVFDQTYTRFLDLQRAEAQAREAQIETSLEKVRSRTLAMQKSDELAGTAAVLFQQLIALGIAPNRLYIIIMSEETPDLEAWVTDEDGSKVSMGFTGNYQKNGSLKKMYEGWKGKKKSLVIDMQGEELQQYFHYLHDELKVPFKGGLEQKRRIQHVAYFSHGLIGMAAPDEQPASTLQLMERFAAVFNLTFTRFNDLKMAEAHALKAEQDLIAIKEAKQKAEEALSELQATQKQLVQAEKMASLGELTAGIAHEIQNPLNFVNNFSEVSKELLEEMREAIEKGDSDEATEIMQDVIQNLEKIAHHGKRADGIVKGMLQHSRSSSGQKELTDINVLCDEYLRLAYHGLRAKDKSFNAKFETSLDDSIGKVFVMPQEMGRVILNLINNAFYAVSERKKSAEEGYEPLVTVSTRKLGNRIEISVADNGTGIPDKVKEKILQPFFTTKPTGQGTGLGLSLSYDIVKAHGGELKVETKEGEGSAFIISLPLV